LEQVKDLEYFFESWLEKKNICADFGQLTRNFKNIDFLANLFRKYIYNQENALDFFEELNKHEEFCSIFCEKQNRIVAQQVMKSFILFFSEKTAFDPFCLNSDDIFELSNILKEFSKLMYNFENFKLERKTIFDCNLVDLMNAVLIIKNFYPHIVIAGEKIDGIKRNF
jgi:hypothetical protein